MTKYDTWREDFRFRFDLRIFYCSLLIIFALASHLLAYGPEGHQIVGAIADDLLAKKPAGAQITALLDGLTLSRTSIIPDEIKAWDKKGPDDENAFPHYRDHPKIDQQLRDFWRANPPNPDPASGIPSHHWFHYTDVPVVPPQKYADGKAGRTKWDIVHMIPYCVNVLRGEIPENNERKITKPVAIILLSHYLGDIHQPLHVGADYFDQGGHEADPDKTTTLEDEGGNSVRLHLSDDAPPHRGVRYKKLHGFWDMDSVITLLPPLDPAMPKAEQKAQTVDAIQKIAHEMAQTEPKNWRLPADLPLNKYAEAWVDEILPIARQAHERLEFTAVHREDDQGKTVAAGDATEKPEPDHLLYRQWASRVVREELQKAGWRLADLLEKSVKSSATSISSEVSEEEKAAATPPAPANSPPPPSPAETKPSTEESKYGEFPANYKKIVEFWLIENGWGPMTAKIDWQTEPKPADMPAYKGQHRYGYLVIFNTAIPGQPLKTRSILIRDGEVVTATGF